MRTLQNNNLKGKNLKLSLIILVILISILPFILNLLGVDFSSTSTPSPIADSSSNLTTQDQKFYALAGALHHALLEWSAVVLAVIAGIAAFIHYTKYKDISVPVIGLALLCAGFTDAFHTLAATRIISANVPNSDFIPFTWALSRMFNASIMIVGVLLSLWLTNQKNTGYAYEILKKQFLIKEKNKTKLLLIVAIIFIAMAIGSVFFAATSYYLPQTTFKNALITRPYDIVPLALFLLSAALVWSWYQNKATTLKFALLLSLIPEVVTQLHMSLGSTALFDNHFNIAHFLKIVAYAILTFGILITLLRKTKQLVNEDVPQGNQNINKLANTDDFLKVGTAKYSQVWVFSLFTFVFAMAVSIAVSSIYYVDTIKATQEQQYKSLENQSDFIAPLVTKIYYESKEDLIFVSKIPFFQEGIQSLKYRNSESFKQWQKSLDTLFSQLLNKNQYYIQVRFINYPSQNELLKITKSNHNIRNAGSNQLDQLASGLSFNESALKKDNVLFFNDSLNSRVDKEVVPFLHLFLPVYGEYDKKLLGVLNLQVDFFSYMHDLNLARTNGKALFFSDGKGQIIYKINSTQEDNFITTNEDLSLQQRFPKLVDVIADNRKKFQLGMDNGIINETVNKGHYRTIDLPSERGRKVIRLFVEMDQEALLVEIKTIQARSLQIGFGLAIIALAIALFLSKRLSNSLSLITSQVTQYGDTGEANNLPVNAQDESGVLARSFHNLLMTQAEQGKALLQQKWALDEHAIVSITDVKGTITYVNEKFTEISGYSQAELIGKNHRILNSGCHNKKFFEAIFKQIYQGNTWQGEICNKAKNGHLYWVSTTIVPFMNKQSKPDSYISIRTDITLNKEKSALLLEAKEELSAEVEKLEMANADLNQFAYVASHDLKSPLNGISQLVSWLEEDCHDILPKESQEHLALLRSRSKRMIALLNDLLEYSRAGKENYQAETFKLAKVVSELFDLQGNNDGFTCTAQDVELCLQRVPFELVIRNLISNAIKHHDKDVGNIDISISIIEENEQNFYLIHVQDDGPGIPIELHEKALEMFQTLQSRDKVEGSGMGLALVKRTIQHQGGTFSIDPSDGRGTLMIIKLPCGNVI